MLNCSHLPSSTNIQYLDNGLPDREQGAIALYLAHIQHGRSFRSLARETGLNPSTVLRRVRKIEDRRDDPLIDDFLMTLSKKENHLSNAVKERTFMQTKQKKAKKYNLSKKEQHALRRLCETDAFLVIGKDLALGAIFKKNGDKDPTRLAIVSKETAKSLVLRDCIKLTKNDKVSIYHITEVGRNTLRRIVEQELDPHAGFGEQHREWGERSVSSKNEESPRKIRVNLRESPLAGLARKKGLDGKAFLDKDLLEAGERLREDFELSQMGPRVAQNWDRFVNGGGHGVFAEQGENGSSAAQKRLQNALTALGDGLGDIALRCCCFLEGLEAAEKRMGWSARSGKIVLRIALQRLRLHYDNPNSGISDMIG